MPSGLTFRAYYNPILKTVPSYLLVGRKFGHRGSLSISLVFCRIILIAGWYYNLKFHPQASVPRSPVDTVATQWHKRISNDFSLELEGRTASSYQGCISRASARKWMVYFPSGRQYLFLFLRMGFLRGESEAYPTQNCCSLRARCPRVGVQIPRQAEA